MSEAKTRWDVVNNIPKTNEKPYRKRNQKSPIAPSEGAIRYIKYHKNRKLYDPVTTEYINSTFLFNLIKAGWEIKIIDSRMKNITHDFLFRNYCRIILMPKLPLDKLIEEIRKN